ncbi:unnamed protein product [Albugo candida]|uniref:Uncharacterized protein n=1 Tax=Albugo candida TaxID=65357 RepID=A0A024GJ76_9STRA|nr:unnamed protein product [Albugo candida]|eukprot:CCI46830.1 unnamed protein product [Albugo candida]
MVSIDISSLPTVTSPDADHPYPNNLSLTSPDVGNLSPRNSSVSDPLPVKDAPTSSPILSNPLPADVVIGQSEADMEIETPLSPNPIPANQPVAMEVDDALPSAPRKPVEQGKKTGNRPSLADILKGHEEIRKDKAAKKATWKVEMPKPLASDLRAIEKLFEEGRPSWEVLSAHLTAAKPFVLPSAKFSVVLETGQALVRTPPAHILQSFVRDHGNVIVDELFEAGKIGQLAKLPGGNLRLLITEEEVCQRLANEKVRILGNSYSFREFDILGSRFFLDIFGIGPEMSTLKLASALHRLGCDVLYENFREAVASKRLSMSTWRVYFCGTSCPEQLNLGGKVCEQICIEGIYYLARGKASPLPVDRLRMSQRSPHCLLLPVNTPQPNRQQKTKSASSAESQLVKSRPTQKPDSINVTMPEVSEQSPTNKLPARKVSSVRDVADGNVSELPNSDPSQQDIPSAVPDVNDNERKLAEKASSKSTEDTWTPVRPRNKRNRSLDRFQTLLSNPPPKSLEGFATSNYFNVLGSVDVDFVKIDVTTKADFGKRYQIVPSKLVVKNDLADSKEASHFMKKNHTRIEKDDRPTRVAEVVDFLIQHNIINSPI